MKFHTLCCWIAAALLSLPVRAGDATQPRPPSRGAAPSPQLVDRLTDWLVDQHGLPRPPSRPKVMLVPPLQIVALRRLGILSDRAQDLARIPPGQREVLAAYDPATRTIYLRDGWSGATPVERSILLHELVHHLQASAGLRYACTQESEELAFAAQERWLGQFGRSLHADFGIDPFTRLVATQCAW